MTRFSVRQFLFWAVLALLVFPQVIFASNNRTTGFDFSGQFGNRTRLYIVCADVIYRYLSY